MGGTGWTHIAPYEGGIAESLEALHRAVFAAGAFRYWIDGDGPEVPTSFDEFVTRRPDEPEGGTHSVLDVFAVADGADFEADVASGRYYNRLYPLTEQESVRVFGSDRPTLEDWETYKGSDEFEMLARERFSGRCLLLYAADEPIRIAVWGSSGY